MPKNASKRAKAPLSADDLADAVQDGMDAALETTNALLAGLLECMACESCQGSGMRPTKDPRVSERCDCRRAAGELLDDLASQDGPGDDDEGDSDDEDEEIEGI